MTGSPLPRDFYQRDPREVAPELLNKLIVVSDGRAGRIVEVEAYCGANDPAAHTYRGKTQRNATMFGPAGHLYVYFSYGIHWCANTVCGEPGEGVGVLLRAIEPVQRVDAIRQARGNLRRDRELGSGPGRLAQALGITGELNGADLVTRDSGVWLIDDGMPPPATPAATPRIGISTAVEHPWRWHVPGSAHVSKVRAAYRRST